MSDTDVAHPCTSLARPNEMGLAQVETVPEAKEFAVKAEALRKVAKQTGESLERQNYFAEAKIRSERRGGELLRDMELRGGDRKSNAHDARLKLADFGIAQATSTRWQLIASLPEQVFLEHLETVKAARQELTSAGVRRLAKQYHAEKDAEQHEDPPLNAAGSDTVVSSDWRIIAASDIKFACIYADPPWKYGNQGTRASTGNHYNTMTVEELCDMPVADVVADDAFLHLWTTNAFIFESPRVLEAWGFEYRSMFVWVKPQIGMGNYWRVSQEYLVLGKRGGLTFQDHALRGWLEAPRAEHSAKPPQVRALLERAGPGPYLEMFARELAPGWSAFGNQIQDNLFNGRASRMKP